MSINAAMSGAKHTPRWAEKHLGYLRDSEKCYDVYDGFDIAAPPNDGT